MSIRHSLFPRVRIAAIPTLVSGLSLLGVAAGCSQDPAFVNASTEASREAAPGGASGDVSIKPRVGTEERNAGTRGSGEAVAERQEVDPGTDHLVAIAPEGVEPSSGEGGAGDPAMPDGSGAGGGSGSGGSGGGTRGGLGENPGSGGGTGGTGGSGSSGGIGNVGGVPAVNPVPAPTVAPPPKPASRAGSPVNYETQQVQGKVDILWLVDDSNSMEWAQTRLREKFESFARKLSEARVDFRVGVTSLDVCDIDWRTGAPKPDTYCPNAVDISGGVVNSRGEMVGPAQGRLVRDPESGKSILTPGVNFVSEFGRMARLGVYGSGLEHGLTAARMAVEKSLSGTNTNFLRSDAFLTVVVLSDEEDDGVQMWCEDAWGNTSRDAGGKVDLSKCKVGGSSTYVDRFRITPYALYNNPETGKPWTSYKFTADMWKSYMDQPSVKGAGKFRLSAITGMRGADGKIACENPSIPSGTGPQEAGTNYIKAAQLTGGVVENICSNEWDKILSNIGQNVGELANKIALPKGKTPWPGSLEVWVDGVKLGAIAYSYEAEGNFLVFKQIPASGAAIKVRYLETVN